MFGFSMLQAAGQQYGHSWVGLWDVLGALGAVLDASWALLGLSWRHLGRVLGHLGDI